LSAEDQERQLLRAFHRRADLSKRLEALKLQGDRIATRKRNGKREGARRYGERNGEQAVLQKMRELRQEGMGNTAISRYLNETQVAPRRGKQWHPTTVANVLGDRRETMARKAKRKEREASS
jgi:hypothetical protein